ncbi:hypothetical protein OHV08_12640 [Streptomyces canus]|uniref:hypothetical protein n=1 Tax=Streptomyces canus TaxID=58343 RepID=UPI0032560246
MHLADSPRVEEVFGQPPVHPRFYSIPGIAEGTKWWREELDEETLECYFGTSGERSSPGYISRTKAVMIGDLGPDLPFALDYRNSLTDPGVVFLGEEGAWRKVAEDVCDLLLMLSP